MAGGERIRITNVPATPVTKIVAYFEAFYRKLSEKDPGHVSVKIAVNLVEVRTQDLPILSRIANHSIVKLGIPFIC